MVVAQEERDAQIRLAFLHLDAERRLADAAPKRCAVKIQLFGDSHDVLQLA
jgi:hypothetical protein